MEHIHIVKRKGHKDIYDEKKVYASVYAACINTHMHKERSEETANAVMQKINKWLDNKKEVTSNDIFKQIINILKEYNSDAAFMYETHRDVS